MYAPFVLIPAFQAESTIAKVVNELLYVSHLPIVVVDDGSTDRTAACAQAAGAEVISYSKNRGKGSALLAGMYWGIPRGFSHAICIDADGQHSVAELYRIFEFDQRTAVVIGRRAFAFPMPVVRRVSNTLTSLVVSICTGIQVPDSQSGFRRYCLWTVRMLPLRAHRFDFETEILFAATSAGASIGSLPISTQYDSRRSAIRGGREIFLFLRQFAKFLWR